MVWTLLSNKLLKMKMRHKIIDERQALGPFIQCVIYHYSTRVKLMIFDVGVNYNLTQIDNA